MSGASVHKPLIEQMGITEGSVVAITGAGGKTTLAFHLGEELVAVGKRVLVTTTTKMFYPESFAGRIVIETDALKVSEELQLHQAGAMFAAKTRIEGGKVAGYDASTVDAVAKAAANAVLLVEADGAARKPYKFYRDDEPVLPGSSTHVVHVIGAETLGAEYSTQLFHRCPQHLEGKVFDLAEFRREMDWYANVKLAGFTGRKILVVNKADEGREMAAATMRDAARPYFDACYCVSLKRKEWTA